MKVEKLTDVVSNPEHPLMAEVDNTFKNQEGDEVICKQCSKSYERGIWNFYDLCDDCFREFDKKRMEERMNFLSNFNNEQKNSK